MKKNRQNSQSLQGPSPLGAVMQQWGLQDLKRAAWLSLAINLLMLAPTAFMMEVYDRVINSRSHATLAYMLGGVIVVYLVTELLDWVRAKMLLASSLRLDADLRNMAFNSMFESRRMGATSSSPHVLGDVRTLREFVSSSVVQAFLDTPISIVFLVLVFFIHPSMAIFALIGALLQLAIGVHTEKWTGPAIQHSARASAGAQGMLGNMLASAEVIQAMGMKTGVYERWMTQQRQFLYLQAKASEYAGSSSGLSKVTQTAQGSLILGLGCWLTLKGVIDPTGGLMIVASVLGGRMMTPMVQIISQWRQVADARDAYHRLDTFLASVKPKSPGLPLPAPKGRLQVENLSAAAPASAIPILKVVQFALDPGDCLAVIGPSASGKTTLARLLLGLWPAQTGKVRLDGVDIHTWDKEELGPWLGYLPQSIELFDGTLAENIGRFEPVDMTKLDRAVEWAGLKPLLDQWPEGYDTLLGTNGARLSGGQRQRVALARAIYGDPKLVVLDEPNASLDAAGEAAMMALLARLKAQGTTVVMITHRVQPLAVADKILLLRDGQVQAFGPKEPILASLQSARAAVQGSAPDQPANAAKPGAAQ